MEEIRKVVSIDATEAVATLDKLKTTTQENTESFKTLGEARQYLDKLKSSLDGLDKSSKAYKDRVKEIDNNQARLSNAIDKTVKVANKAYSELSNQLVALQQKFKAANTEAERLALASQIDAVETKLKGMDTTVTNLQASVSAYSSEFVNGLGDIAAGLDIAIPGLEQYYRYFKDVLLAGRSFKEIFKGLKVGFTDQDAVVKESVKSFGLLEGSILATSTAQVGYTRNIQKSIQTVELSNGTILEAAKVREKLAASEAAVGKVAVENSSVLSQALEAQAELVKVGKEATKALDDTAKAGKNAATSLGFLGKAFKSLKSLINPVTVALAAAATGIALIVTAVKKAKAELEFSTAIRKTSAGAADQIATLTLLSKKYKELGDDAKAKGQFLEDYKSSIEKTGIAITDLNKAEDVLVNNTDTYLESLKKKAQAQGAYNLLVQETSNYLEKRARLETELEQKQGYLKDVLASGVSTNTLGLVAQITELERQLDKLEARYKEKSGKLLEYATLTPDKKDTGSAVGIPTSAELLKSFEGLDLEKTLTEFILEPLEKVSDKAFQIWNRTQQNRVTGLDKELLDLRTKYETEKDLLLESGLSTKALTEQYEKERLATIARYREKELSQKESYLNQQQQLDNQLISYRTDNEYQQRSLALESEHKYLEQLKLIYQERMNLYAKDSEEYKAAALALEDVNNRITVNLTSQAKLQEDVATHVKETWLSNIEVLTSGLDSIVNAWQAVLDAEKDKLSEEESLTQQEIDNYNKKRDALKAFQIASIIISAAASSFDIWRGYNLEKVANAETAAATGPAAASTLATLNAASLVKAIANQATTAANAVASIASIKSETLKSSTSSASQVSPTPVATQYSPNYSTNVTGQTETTNLANALSDIKVYVTEYDLQQAAKRVEVRQSETTF